MKRQRPSHQGKSGSSGPTAGPSSLSAEGRMPGIGLGPGLAAMVGLSGFACLVYQILWMRQLGLLFGNTSQAAAITLAVFFGGLAGGSWFWGRRSDRIANPLRAYVWLEFGIAVCGVMVIAAPMVIRNFYPMVYQGDGAGLAFSAFKSVMTLIMVFPPAVLMGGTLPMVGQMLIREPAVFGKTTAMLYALNTIGAGLGAFATAFILIWYLGLRLTCGVAMAASVLAGVIACRLSRRETWAAPGSEIPEAKGARKKADPRPVGLDSAASPLSRTAIRWLAVVSGFNLLALEVIWTRMLAQVHENSVYGFSTVLIVVLASLAMGAWQASWLAGRPWPAPRILVLLLVSGGTILGFTPFVFTRLTDGLGMLPTDASFAAYVFRLFGTGFLSIGPPCFLLGGIFPFLMKCEEHFAGQPGRSIGTLSAINTVGAILGSLAAGFLLLEWLGLWNSIQWIAAAYLAVAMLVPSAKSEVVTGIKAMGVVMILLGFTVLNPSRLPSSWTKDNFGRQETLLEKWEGSDCTVTVVKDSQDHLAIKINSNYSLGSTFAIGPQIYQARLPLLAYPSTDSVFFLGMGTGITAGEALDRGSFPNITKVVACELSPGVVAASRKYFAGAAGRPDMTNGLFSDPRASVLTEDGRTHLMGTRESYAMINADLFLPYRRGTGNLYSREHFQQAKERLKPGGVFVQWLPLYQVSEREFGIIARTMLAVFPQVSLWRGNFQPGAEFAAMVGHADEAPVPACALDAEQAKREAVAGATYRDMHDLMLPINEQTVLLFYGGNLSRSSDLFDAYPLNTDDRPVIEFGTSRSLHRPAREGKPQFLQERFAELVDLVQARTPPDQDPLLTNRTPGSRRLPLAGSAFHRASIASVHADEETWRREWEKFLAGWIAGTL